MFWLSLPAHKGLMLLYPKMVCRKQAPTDEADGFLEPNADFSHVVILHWDTLIEKLSFEVVWAAGGDVEHGSDPQGLQNLPVGGVVAAAQVQKGENLYWPTLQKKKTGPIRLLCTKSAGLYAQII